MESQGCSFAWSFLLALKGWRRRIKVGFCLDAIPVQPTAHLTFYSIPFNVDGKAKAKDGDHEAKDGKEVRLVVDEEDEKKEDFMIPISFQSDMTHIHAKAGFTAVGH